MEPISVLLVDDSPTFLHVASQFLEDQSDGTFRVVGTASGGLEGIAKSKALHPDLVLIDIKMPDISGLVAIPRLRADSPEIGIIALTLIDTNEYRRAALAAGADEFVGKESMHERLLPAIDRVMRARAAVQAHAHADLEGGRP